MATRPQAKLEFLELRNHHGEIRRILSGILSGSEIAKFDQKIIETTKFIFSLGRKHLLAAEKLLNLNIKRSAVSRAYYACYSFSRAVRYWKFGYYDQNSTDHTKVGELPKDFPNVAQWATTLGEMRFDRNIVDYEPNSNVIKTLKRKPRDTVEKAKEFRNVARDYLKARGVRV